MSSLVQRTSLTRSAGVVEQRPVRVTTLDTLAKELDLRPPFGLEIDAEGFELEVIRGARSFLEPTQFITSEVSVMQRFVGGYTFEELVVELADRGFHVFDVVGLAKPDAVGTRYVDLAFLRDGGVPTRA